MINVNIPQDIQLDLVTFIDTPFNLLELLRSIPENTDLLIELDILGLSHWVTNLLFNTMRSIRAYGKEDRTICYTGQREHTFLKLITFYSILEEQGLVSITNEDNSYYINYSKDFIFEALRVYSKKEDDARKLKEVNGFLNDCTFPN